MAAPEPRLELGGQLGLLPLFARYNSGLSIHRNGVGLALQLQQLATGRQSGLQRLVVIGHSMGGLVACAALQQAGVRGLDWPARLSELVCVGSPHARAPLERVGHVMDQLLQATSYTSLFARLGRLRSAGITDLREDWVLKDGTPSPLPAGLLSAARLAAPLLDWLSPGLG